MNTIFRFLLGGLTLTLGVVPVASAAEGGRKDKGNLHFDSWTQVSRPNHMTVRGAGDHVVTQ